VSWFEFCVNRPVAVTMRIVALVLLGWVCLERLPIDLLPNVSIPTVTVITNWPNVPPEELETEITRPVEEAVSTADNIYAITSSTTEGTSRVSVQFNWGTSIDVAAVDVLQLVERARVSFPTDPTLQTPVVFKFDPTMLPILTYGVSGINDPVKLYTVLNNEIGPMLESVDGVASATTTGGNQRAIIVDADPVKMRAYGISMTDIGNRIALENVNLPAGIAKMSSTEFTVRSIGNFVNPQEAQHIPLGVYNGRVVSLSDVAKVYDSHQETRIITRLNGEPSVGVAILRQTNANTVTTAENVKEKLKQINKIYPQLKWRIAYDQSGFIQNSIDDLKSSACIGGVLAIIILMFFLRSIRSTLVVALSIPISIISTFSLVYFCGFTLNTISLSALALSTGLIVDDAVVVLENIFRHVQRDGKHPFEAAVSGSREIASAVMASTFTVMIVFLPLMLIKGQAGQVFSQMALVVIFSISVSLFDATTIVPMFAARFIDEQEVLAEEDPSIRKKRIGPVTRAFDWFGGRFHALDQSYRRGLDWSLRHRWHVIAGALGICVASLALVPMLGSEMMPETDSGDLQVDVRLPIGTALSKTNEAMKKVEKIIMSNPDVATVFSATGTNIGLRGVGTTAVPNRGSCQVKLKEDRKHTTEQVIEQIQRQTATLPGVRTLVTLTDLVTQILTGSNNSIEVDVFGKDLKQLTASANDVMESIRGVPGLESLDLGVQDAEPEMQWLPNRQKAQTMGVSFTDISNVLYAATSGTQFGYYLENGYEYPIYVQVQEDKRKTLQQIIDLPVLPSLKPNGTSTSSTTSTGPAATVTLGQVAVPHFELGPNQITRLNRQRYIAVTGRAQQGRSTGDIQADIGKILPGVKLPEGSYWDWGITQKRTADEYSGMVMAVLLAIGLIYILLASQFESFIYPLVVLTSVPLCSVGVVLALFISGRPFGLTAFIGLLMLVGIVVKNGILLVDYTNQLRQRGMARKDAILRAGPTRLRPILMTSSAAVLGMLPLALALARGSETEAPLATAVIGGLTTSTVLTLFVVPVVYTLFDDLATLVMGKRKPVGVPEPAPEPEPAGVTGSE
jgi:HAE1 family hydrophobic/amphiphilic exporter-1